MYLFEIICECPKEMIIANSSIYMLTIWAVLISDVSQVVVFLFPSWLTLNTAENVTISSNVPLFS